MTRHEMETELTALYRDLETAREADEQTACLTFNTDSREEILQIITGEIESLEASLAELYDYDHRELNNLRTADRPWLCW